MSDEMFSGDRIVALIAVAGSLVLALRALRSRHVAPGKRAAMAAVWLVIIVIVAWFAGAFTS